MGLSDLYPYHDEISWINYELSPAEITFEDLKQEQLIFLDKPIVYGKYRNNGFNTSSKKLELYSKRFEEKGYSPMPIPLSGVPDLHEDAEAFPLVAINYRPRQFVHTNLHNIRATTILHDNPTVWMNESNLKKYKLKEKDTIVIESKVGEGVFQVALKSSLDDENVMLEFGWGNPTDNKTDINRLTNDQFFDPISGTTPNRLYRVRVKKVMKDSIVSDRS
jgi:anaerobic selenocysteine-containing dehydrogenase